MSEVSVICPVYNAERFLRRSVDSVLSQTFAGWELVLVDDGSTDSSGGICDEYAARDHRVKVIHKSNGGVSSARQAGMEAASGKYFIHLDSDDWMDSDLLGKMFAEAERTGADVVCCDFCQVYKDRREISRQCHPGYSRKRIAEAVCGGRMAHSLWNKLIRRTTYDACGLSFPENLATAEDAFVCLSLFIRGVDCAFCEGTYYYYDRFISGSSLTRSKYRRSLDSIVECVSLLENAPGDAGARRLALFNLKSIAKVKAFHALEPEEFRRLYREINLRYVCRNIFRMKKIEGYVALALVTGDNKAALRLYESLRSRFGRD